MNEASKAYERAVCAAHMKAHVLRAAALWETWIVLGSVAYLLAHFAPWAARGFPVVGQ